MICEIREMKLISYQLAMKQTILLISICVIQISLNAQTRDSLLFDFNWHFKMGDPSDIDTTFNYPEIKNLQKTKPEELELEKQLALRRNDLATHHLGEKNSFVQSGFNDTNWKLVNLPHDWVVELPINPNGNVSKGLKDIDSIKGTSIGWYRKTFQVPLIDKGKIISLEFEGVYRNALFWINGHCLGRNVSGYMGCFFNINKFINYGGKNTIVVRVDASHDEGWWYEGAGIYRHVWLIKTQSIHIAHWGTFVQSKIENQKAYTTIKTEIKNDGIVDKNVALSSRVVDASGKTIAQLVNKNIIVKAGKLKTIVQEIIVNNPTLWTIEKPYLYSIKNVIRLNNSVQDEYITQYGFRTIYFDKDSGFYLNGKRTFIKGVCIHQDHAGVGTAMPDKLEEYRLQKLKEMGANAYRTSHNPQSPYLYDACDRLGILILDETRKMSSNDAAIDQLKNMIKRDRNHPSVILWGLGNEEEFIQGTLFGENIALQMQNVVHSMDSTRLVTVAMNGKWGEGFSKAIDVQGFNYFKIGDMDAFRNKFPNMPAIGTEEGSTLSTRGVYVNNEAKGYISSYQTVFRKWSATPEQWLQYYSKRPWVAGAFVWTGIGYRGEPGYRNYPNVLSSYGIMDICCFPKDQFYLYQSAWTNNPVLHIMPHWNWPDSIGKNIKVWIYSNSDEVELFLNDKSLGKQKTKPLDHLEWNVAYIPGRLTAKAFSNGTLIKETMVETTGKPFAIRLSTNTITLNADEKDIAVINFSVVDDKGRIVPEADNDISFQIIGEAKNIGVGNGDPISEEPDHSNKRKVFMGLGQLIIQSTKQAGTINVIATGKGLKTERIRINSTNSYKK